MNASIINSRTVLVVDDDADMRLYLRGCLQTLGFPDVLEATNGAEALQLTRTLHVDLVISDVFMPHVDGYALCESLKAHEQNAGTPVLLISGESDAARLKSAGADAFLVKPFNTSMLEESIAPLLSLR